jgi:hypothetical protein
MSRRYICGVLAVKRGSSLTAMRISNDAVALLARAGLLPTGESKTRGAFGSAERAWLEQNWLPTTIAVGSIAVSSVRLFGGHI